MINFSTKKVYMIPSLGTVVKETEKIDKFLLLLEKSGVLELLDDKKIDASIGGRPAYNKADLLAAILYCFSFQKGTLRDIEDASKFDLRVMYILQSEQPCYVTISNFINDYIVPNCDRIFSLITKAILDECSLNFKNSYIDGSKFEADANKYKFVWKPTTYHQKLSDKIRDLLKRQELARGISNSEIISSKEIAQKLTELSALVSSETDSNKSIQLKQDFNDLSDYLAKSLEYEEKERICGPNRNSYYKTDYDATAMCLKEDYYSGLGSNMHAAYNCQIEVSYGIIICFLVTQSRADINDFIPILTKHYEMYSAYPEAICADAGYGSLDNYAFMEEKGITNYVKYVNWEGEVSAKRPSCYHLNDDETITCLNGNIGIQVTINNRHPRKSDACFYRVEGCDNCNFALYCKRYMKDKTESFKIFEVSVQLQKYIQQSEKNLLSPTGIEMRVNRSSQVEGAFGVIKQDIAYERFRRTTIQKVTTEFMLVCLGYNIRKLFRFYDGKAKFEYWKAPDNLKPESKKKPSAKRLTKKASKVKTKSANELAKSQKK